MSIYYGPVTQVPVKYFREQLHVQNFSLEIPNKQTILRPIKMGDTWNNEKVAIKEVSQ